MINKYIIAASVAILIVLISYVVQFYLLLDYGISNDTAVWGQLGDYIGGVLNPTLSFVSLVLLIKSLTLQNEANNELRQELKNNEKTEKIRSFETLFFNMINSQKELFHSFAIDLTKDDKKAKKQGVDAVILIEDEIENIRERNENDDKIKSMLEKFDSKDQIFGLTRSFYIMVKTISDSLNDTEGFSSKERASHLHTLINFTDFAQLRMILIAMQFTEFESVKYLRNHQEFNAVLQEVGLDYNIY
ncbi:hypothetical protein [Thiothrix unzii]|uniref:hypothetical protein n=1 Tax=Thiothrix unzii TaxID=111769 RepID=UPI002A359662|nr:hypothetical protein [Thiothrix unzii]MDX9990269.1 hypothetical protein [Thiothrix unzii]